MLRKQRRKGSKTTTTYYCNLYLAQTIEKSQAWIRGSGVYSAYSSWPLNQLSHTVQSNARITQKDTQFGLLAHPPRKGHTGLRRWFVWNSVIILLHLIAWFERSSTGSIRGVFWENTCSACQKFQASQFNRPGKYLFSKIVEDPWMEASEEWQHEE